MLRIEFCCFIIKNYEYFIDNNYTTWAFTIFKFLLVKLILQPQLKITKIIKKKTQLKKIIGSHGYLIKSMLINRYCYCYCLSFRFVVVFMWNYNWKSIYFKIILIRNTVDLISLQNQRKYSIFMYVCVRAYVFD